MRKGQSKFSSYSDENLVELKLTELGADDDYYNVRSNVSKLKGFDLLLLSRHALSR